MTTTSLFPTLKASIRDFSRLCSPASIAMVGATNDAAKYGKPLGTRALRGSLPAYLINKDHPSICDYPAFPSLVDLGGPASAIAANDRVILN